MRLLPRLRGSFVARALVGAAAVLLFLLPVPVHASFVHASVDGQAIDVARAHLNIRGAARAAGLPLRAGRMRSITGQVLAEGVLPPKVWRNGRRAGADTPVHTGDRIRVENRPDYVEPADTVIQPIPVPGFPDVEYQIWHGGVPGRVSRVLGRFSGQSAGDQVLEGPVPPTLATGPEVLLTFDDGPDPRWTPQILAILQAKDVKAVFCVVGAPLARHPEFARQEHDAGHAMCDHTLHHDMHMSAKPQPYAAGEIDGDFDAIKSITGAPPRFYRGPGGDLSPFIIGEAHRLGMRVLGWSVDTQDYRRPGAAAIQDRAAVNVRNGGVILMHDGGGDRSQTVAQLPGLIDRLRAAGYSIVLP